MSVAARTELPAGAGEAVQKARPPPSGPPARRGPPPPRMPFVVDREKVLDGRCAKKSLTAFTYAIRSALKLSSLVEEGMEDIGPYGANGLHRVVMVLFVRFCALDQPWALCTLLLRLTCPLLIRVFTKTGEHHTMDDYANRGKVPKDEVQIYTWMDATLRELTDLVKEVAPEARRRDARLSFAFVYPDRRGRNVVRNVGITHANGVRRGGDDHRTLFELSFQTGDFLDVAIL